MKNIQNSQHLRFEPFSLAHTAFIRALVNTEGWIKFIGDRNVHTEEDAVAYAERILANPNVQYWVVSLIETGVPVGVISYIKRDYLDYHDIGFAFLPQYSRKGYAFEATRAAIAALSAAATAPKLYATTMEANTNSIGLLKKLGFEWEQTITVEQEDLLLYAYAFR